MISDPSFRIILGPALCGDLRQRLARARWSDAVTADWQYGMDRAFLQALALHWHDQYDFGAAERRLNEMPQFRAKVGDFGIHYILLKGQGPRPTPLLLMNGWPSSFVEFRKLAPMLADPAAFGASTDESFDVVMPALPGFGFSDRPMRPHQVWPDDLFHRLMTEHLGYQHYVASGTDIGAGVARHLALQHADAVRGIHVSSVVDPPSTPTSQPLTVSETAYKERSILWEADEGAYEHLHYTKPQTLAFALADSPIGLASWIVEKFHSWSDHGPDLLQTFPEDMLLDNVMIYWLTETIGSSMRAYYDNAHFRPPVRADNQVTVPTAVCIWPKNLVNAPRSWADRFYNVLQYTTQDRGGHFPAWEAPEAYARDLRAFTKLLIT